MLGSCIQILAIILLCLLYVVLAVCIAAIITSTSFEINQHGTRTAGQLLLVGWATIDIISILLPILQARATLNGQIGFRTFLISICTALLVFTSIHLFLGYFAILAIGEMQP
jgi:hypothetical protein